MFKATTLSFACVLKRQVEILYQLAAGAVLASCPLSEKQRGLAAGRPPAGLSLPKAKHSPSGHNVWGCGYAPTHNNFVHMIGMIVNKFPP